MVKELYIKTDTGEYYWGDSLNVMQDIPDGSIDAIICSPPFEGDALINDANRTGDKFVEWFTKFFSHFERVLSYNGQVAFELGGLWLEDSSGKSIQQISFLQSIISSKWKLIQELFYYNPQLLEVQPKTGVNRLADSITPIWIVGRNYNGYYNSSVSNKEVYKRFVRGNLLEFNTSNVNDQNYENFISNYGKSSYKDRWPSIVPAFLIELLTTEGQTILDPFAGTAATCHAAERLKRHWIGIESNRNLSLHVNAMFNKN